MFGIDFWHTVEFSRSGRAPTRPFGRSRGNPVNLVARLHRVKRDRHASRPPEAPHERRARGAIEVVGSRSGTGRQLAGVRDSLSNDVVILVTLCGAVNRDRRLARARS